VLLLLSAQGPLDGLGVSRRRRRDVSIVTDIDEDLAACRDEGNTRWPEHNFMGRRRIQDR